MEKKAITLLIIVGVIIPILFSYGIFNVGYSYVSTGGNTTNFSALKSVLDYGTQVARVGTALLVVLYCLNIAIYKFAEVEDKKYIIVTTIIHVICIAVLIGYFYVQFK